MRVARRIHLCDDSAAYRTLARILLTEAGEEIVGESADGRECIACAQQEEADVILLDVNMPVMSGVEALPCLRRAAPDSTIVILTSSTEPGLHRRVLELGADRALAKPLDVVDLPRQLERALAA